MHQVVRDRRAPTLPAPESVGDGMMIDSPHTGAFVRLKAINWDAVVGVSRPG